MQLFEIQGLLAGKCLPGDMLVGESLSQYFLRQFNQRDELGRQVSALQLSQDNIINALGIKGEGAHSKLVIEYVHGLMTEKSRIAAEASMLKEVNADIMRSVYRAKTHMNSGKAVDAERALQCAIGRKPGSTEDTDAAIAEIKSQGVDEQVSRLEDEYGEIDDVCAMVFRDLREHAENLRAGRKG